MRIVYVEDNIANVHLVKRVARMGKHEIINYIDGMDAFNNFESDDPDLVLMDIQLAGELTGIEVVKKLREKGFKTPIYAVTAYAMVGDKERCMEAGCTGYMSKPLPVAELVKLFQTYEKQKNNVPAEKPQDAVTTVAETAETSDNASTDKDATKSKIDNTPAVTDDAPQVAEASSVDHPEDKAQTEQVETGSESATKTVVAETETQEAPTPPTEPARPIAMKKDNKAEGDDKLAETNTSASVPTKAEDNKSNPSAKMY